MPEQENNDDLSRREAELLVKANDDLLDERLDAHRREHSQQNEAIDKALASEKAQSDQHNIAHDKAHDAHEEKHKSESEAIKTALTAVGAERKIHAEAHTKEHEGHQREHGLNNLAIDKAEQANDKRFGAANAYREQIDNMIRLLASKEALESLQKEVDRRFEDVRLSLGTLEKTDVKAEGKGLGQSALIAYIVAGVSLLGSLVVLSNLLTAAP